jgi:hypothetical protein
MAAGSNQLLPANPVVPASTDPETTLTYQAKIYNHKARNFYAKHGVPWRLDGAGKSGLQGAGLAEGSNLRESCAAALAARS